MNKLLICLAAALSLSVYASAQQKGHRNCGSNHYKDYQEKKYPELIKRRALLEKEIAKNKEWKSSNRENGSVTIIPVVVHVLYSSSTDNISEAQIQSQIDVLNADFRKLNSNINTVVSQFQARATDAEIQFCLATVDPNGGATTGITRTATTTTSFALNDNMKSSSTGGVDAWDPSKYLNLWIVPDLDDSVLGFAQFPGGQSWSDGVVIADQFFGNMGTSGSGQYGLGRTATHEVGHYLGLYHIWGDSNCGDDGISDTPTQETSSSGCPITSTTCDGSLDNVQNYMDYSSDNCMAMFTLGQAERMWDVLNSSRSGLKSSANTKCSNDNPPIAAFSGDVLKVCAGEEVSFTDLSTGLPNSWAWTFENGTPSTSALQNPKVVFSTGGSHSVTLVATNDNGPSDLVEELGYIEVSSIDPPTVSNEKTCDGPITLSATTVLSGGQVEWYSASDLTNQLHVGNDYSTSITQTTNFYAVVNSGGSPFEASNSQGTGGFHAGNQGVYFDATDAFKLISATVYAESAGSFTMEYTDPSGVKTSKTINVQAGENEVEIGVDVVAGNDHLLFVPSGGAQLHRDNANVSYPYDLGGLGSVVRSTADGVELDYYYYFYNWKIQKEGCLSSAVEVEAKLDLCVGVDELLKNVSVFPNPNNGDFTVLNSSGLNGVVSVFDLRGLLVREFTLRAGDNYISGMRSGSYIVQIRIDDRVVNKTIVVQK